MSRRGVLFSGVVLILSLILIVIQQFNIKRIATVLGDLVLKQQNEEKYIISSFDKHNLIREADVMKFCLDCARDSICVVYIPESLCRACFSSLLLAFQDNEYPFSRIMVISEKDDYEIRSECVSRGISYRTSNYSYDGLDDIFVVRYYRRVYPIAMKYNLERESILRLFLDDVD